jgi:hypothetical protein
MMDNLGSSETRSLTRRRRTADSDGASELVDAHRHYNRTDVVSRLRQWPLKHHHLSKQEREILHSLKEHRGGTSRKHKQRLLRLQHQVNEAEARRERHRLKEAERKRLREEQRERERQQRKEKERQSSTASTVTPSTSFALLPALPIFTPSSSSLSATELESPRPSSSVSAHHSFPSKSHHSTEHPSSSSFSLHFFDENSRHANSSTIHAATSSVHSHGAHPSLHRLVEQGPLSTSSSSSVPINPGRPSKPFVKSDHPSSQNGNNNIAIQAEPTQGDPGPTAASQQDGPTDDFGPAPVSDDGNGPGVTADQTTKGTDADFPPSPTPLPSITPPPVTAASPSLPASPSSSSSSHGGDNSPDPSYVIYPAIPAMLCLTNQSPCRTSTALNNNLARIVAPSVIGGLALLALLIYLISLCRRRRRAAHDRRTIQSFAGGGYGSLEAAERPRTRFGGRPQEFLDSMRFVHVLFIYSVVNEVDAGKQVDIELGRRGALPELSRRQLYRRQSRSTNDVSSCTQSSRPVRQRVAIQRNAVLD